MTDYTQVLQPGDSLTVRVPATVPPIVVPPPPPPPPPLPPPSGTLWPFEPAGWPVLNDYGFADDIPVSSADQAIPGSPGWHINYNGIHGGATARRTQDASAPVSPPNVLELPYPIGFIAGTGPATLYKPLNGMRKLYAGFTVKANAGWQGNPVNMNKLCYMEMTTGGSMPIVFYGPVSGPWELRMFPQYPGSLDKWYPPNLTTKPFTAGVWHRVEWWMDMPAGRIGMALDGVQLADYTGVPMPSGGVGEYQIAAVWGGANGVKTQQDYLWFDHVHLSGS